MIVKCVSSMVPWFKAGVEYSAFEQLGQIKVIDGGECGSALRWIVHRDKDNRLYSFVCESLFEEVRFD